MDGEELQADEGPLLIGLGGFGTRVASGLDLPERNILLLDTDRRSSRSVGRGRFRLVGEPIVGGEGCGGNLNMARACFRKDMEDLAETFLRMRPVIILSSAEGATGLAGSVEIGGLLLRTDRPSFSVLIRRSDEQASGTDPTHLARAMLNGPLKPGCLIDLARTSSGPGQLRPVSDESGLDFFLGALCRTFSRDALLMLPPSVLGLMRKDGGPFKALLFRSRDTEGCPMIPDHQQGNTVVLVGLDPRTAVADMKALSNRLSGGSDKVHIGFFPLKGASIEGAIIQRATGGESEQLDGAGPRVPGGLVPDGELFLEAYKFIGGGYEPVQR